MSGKVPAQSKANKLDLPIIPSSLQDLNVLEICLLGLRIPFMKMIALPSGKQRCIHGPAINVPSKVDTLIEILPRLPSDNAIIPLKLKRKLQYKSHYLYDFVSIDKVLCVHDVPGDGNCLFHAIAYQLPFSVSAQQLRHDLVQYLENQPIRIIVSFLLMQQVCQNTTEMM